MTPIQAARAMQEAAAGVIEGDGCSFMSLHAVAQFVRALDPADVLAGSDPDAVARLVEAAEMPRAWHDVQAERVRQVAAEGWTTAHDDCHELGEIAQVAACYALSGTPADEAVFIHGRWKDFRDLNWPFGWDREWWKPSDRRRNLVKAGALILAEIERLDRAALAAMEASHD